MTKFPVAVLVALAICCGPALAQPVSATPSLDAVSVKVTGNVPRPPGVRAATGGPGTNDPTRFTYTGVTLEYMLMKAYDLKKGNVFGPAWISDNSDDRAIYTLTGLVPPGTSTEQFKLMLQNLLAERFQLTLHHGTKEYPGYDLVVSAGGPKLKAYVPQPDGADAASGGQSPDADGFPRIKPNATFATLGPAAGGGWGTFRSRYRMSMNSFTKALLLLIRESGELGATSTLLNDKTGLTGVYEFTLEFAGVALTHGPAPVEAGDDAAHVASDPGGNGPTLFSALEKQLGLKLVKAKGVPVDILVIDHADKVPTEN